MHCFHWYVHCSVTLCPLCLYEMTKPYCTVHTQWSNWSVVPQVHSCNVAIRVHCMTWLNHIAKYTHHSAANWSVVPQVHCCNVTMWPLHDMTNHIAKYTAQQTYLLSPKCTAAIAVCTVHQVWNDNNNKMCQKVNTEISALLWPLQCALHCSPCINWRKILQTVHTQCNEQWSVIKLICGHTCGLR